MDFMILVNFQGSELSEVEYEKVKKSKRSRTRSVRSPIAETIANCCPVNQLMFRCYVSVFQRSTSTISSSSEKRKKSKKKKHRKISRSVNY